MPKEKKPPRITIASLQAQVLDEKEVAVALAKKLDAVRDDRDNLIRAAHNNERAPYGEDRTYAGAMERLSQLHQFKRDHEAAESITIRVLREQIEQMWAHLRALSGLEAKTFTLNNAKGLEISRRDLGGMENGMELRPGCQCYDCRRGHTHHT